MQLFPNVGRPSVAIRHGTGGVTVRRAERCMICDHERALKTEEGDRNTQSTNGVVRRRRRI